MKETKLQKAFEGLNSHYFDGKVPISTKVVFGEPTRNADAHYDKKRNEIVINKVIRDHDTLVLICLLHEMIHAKLESTYVGSASSDDPFHGMIYQAEIVRLFNAGAYDGLL